MKSFPNAEILAFDRSSSDYIPYLYHIDETTVKTQNDCYVKTFRLMGVNFETTSAENLDSWARHLNTLIINIQNNAYGFDIAFWTHCIRSNININLGNRYKTGFSHALAHKYENSLGKGETYINELYFSIVFKSLEAPKTSSLKRSFTKKTEEENWEDEILQKINSIAEIIEKSLERYEPQILGVYTYNKVRYSSLCEFYHYLINLEHVPVPLCSAPIQDTLLISRILTGADTLEVRGPVQTRFTAALTIKGYPSESYAGQFNSLLNLPHEFMLTQSFALISTGVAQGLIKRHASRLKTTGDNAKSQVGELETALDDLMSGRICFGEHHFELFPIAQTGKKLNEALSAARKILSETNCICVREDLALEAAFWAQLPGNFQYRPRPALINSKNFVSFNSMHNYASGNADGNFWGEAVTVFKTRSGATPYFFNFHLKNGLGNTLIIGPSGSGKTVLQGFLLVMLEKFDAFGIIFDKDKGAKLATLARGGLYFDLRLSERTGFNPFALEPTERNKTFLFALLKKIVARQGENVAISQEKALMQAIEGVFSLSKWLRRLSSVLDFLDPLDPEGIAARLDPWVGSGRLAWVFDNPTDNLRLKDAREAGFDLTEFLDVPEVRTPIVMYLWHRIEELVDGRRLFVFIDEFWKVLQDDYFEKLLRDKFKTIRKQNWFLVCATQQPSDCLNSPIAKPIIENCATKIFMPNSTASHTDYIDGFKLTDREFEIILNESEAEHGFLVKQGLSSVICQLDLAGFEEELAVLSGTTRNIVLLETIHESTGLTGEELLNEFHRLRGVS